MSQNGICEIALTCFVGEEKQMNTENRNGSEDWIEHTVDKVNEHYMGRKVILWGSYPVSDDIKKRLKDKYGINTAFYVDGDINKIDNNNVFSADCLKGKADEYYVVIPIAFYQSVKDKMSEAGYRKETDYYYFCDCIIRDEEDYYEDTHGNQVIGKHRGLKFVFSGFHSRIEIGENVSFANAAVYLHNDCQVSINSNSTLCNCDFHMSNFIEGFAQNIFAGNGTSLKIGKGTVIKNFSMLFYQDSKILFGENVKIFNATESKTYWEVGLASTFEIGDNSQFHYGHISTHAGALLRIGKQFSIGPRYEISADSFTDIMIGNDCLFSWDIVMLSSDGHSIFDIATGENINFPKNPCKKRYIEIGNHVWVGMRGALLYNTKIGDGSMVGACSLVKNVIPNNCIAVGTPAKVVRKNIAWCEPKYAEDIMECGQEYINNTMEW